jgi:hypothetical protein
MPPGINDAVRFARRGGAGLLIAGSLLFAPYIATADESRQTTIRTGVKSFGAAVKRDAKALGDGCRDGAHRVAIAAKAVGHQIATAAKRSAAESRAAFRGAGRSTPSS